MAVFPSAQSQIWGRWTGSEQNNASYPMPIETSGFVNETYNHQTTGSPDLNRPVMAPQFHSYHGLPHQPEQNNTFHFQGSFASGITCGPVPQFDINYVRPRPHVTQPLPVNVASGFDNIRVSLSTSQRSPETEQRSVCYPQKPSPTYTDVHHETQSQSPPMKFESRWTGSPSTTSSIASSTPNSPLESKTITPAEPINGAQAFIATTSVDLLMRAIQARSARPSSETRSEKRRQERAVVEKSKASRKRYLCNVGKCTKFFHQKTHLDIHIRAHTGHRPFICRSPGCGRLFSQLGNLRTHERRHTGEKPFSCDICGKGFAQRGNVRAHQIVHNGSKPFVCRLDNCEKKFTQLGNMKQHQNRFHQETIDHFATKFASYNDEDIRRMTPTEKELFNYFSVHYKNSNMGIRGRGQNNSVPLTGRSNTNLVVRREYSTTKGVSTGEEDYDTYDDDGRCSSATYYSEEGRSQSSGSSTTSYPEVNVASATHCNLTFSERMY